MSDKFVSAEVVASPKIMGIEVLRENPAACCDVDHSQHEEFEKTTGRWDKVGLTLSGLCAIHCALTPLLVLALPVLGKAFENPWVHIIMALFVVPVGVFAFFSGYKHHKQPRIVALGLIGLTLIGAASVGPAIWFTVLSDEVVTIIGSGFLISAHLMNRKACACEAHSHSH